jgi:hypothetical protein
MQNLNSQEQQQESSFKKQVEPLRPPSADSSEGFKTIEGPEAEPLTVRQSSPQAELSSTELGIGRAG